jgi:hypothetical protein
MSETNTPLPRTFKPNPDMKRRDELLGFSELLLRGTVEAFCEVDARSLRQLIDEGFVDPDRRHHDSPTVREFAAFLERWPQVTAHGFVDQPERPEGRVVVEGVEVDLERVPQIAREALREEMAWFAGDAAQYLDEAGYIYAWWG